MDATDAVIVAPPGKALRDGNLATIIYYRRCNGKYQNALGDTLVGRTGKSEERDVESWLGSGDGSDLPVTIRIEEIAREALLEDDEDVDALSDGSEDDVKDVW